MSWEVAENSELTLQEARKAWLRARCYSVARSPSSMVLVGRAPADRNQVTLGIGAQMKESLSPLPARAKQRAAPAHEHAERSVLMRSGYKTLDELALASASFSGVRRTFRKLLRAI